MDNLDQELKHILRSDNIASGAGALHPGGHSHHQRHSLGGGANGTPPLPALISPGPTPESSPSNQNNNLSVQQQRQQQQTGGQHGTNNKPDLLDSTTTGHPKKGSGSKSLKTSNAARKFAEELAVGGAVPASAIGALSLDLESVLGLQTDMTSDDSTVDMGDAAAIRKQLDGLENMYSEVLKLLGLRKYGRPPGGPGGPGSNALDGRRRKMYGSMSSLPSVSSIGSRHIYKDRSKGGADMGRGKRPGSGGHGKEKSYNKRFQRLESHVVTLARSVAHLSSEMRNQQMLIQEVEALRHEIQQMRVPGGAPPRGPVGGYVDPENFFQQGPHQHVRGQSNQRVKSVQEKRVEKLKSFFGDEPPLLRLFLKNLGYEKYASAFEEAKIGLLELPYLSEERLEKLGVPMGPRMRILQEARASIAGHPAPGGSGGAAGGDQNYSFYIL